MLKSTATSAPITPVVIQEPTIAELDIANKKITKTVTWNYMPFGLDRTQLSDRKENLVASVVKENDGDVLVEPQWEYTKTSFGERTLTVTGFVAKYKNFHKATPQDIEALKVTAPCGGPNECGRKGGFKVANFFNKK
jgi:hypothetical protein